MQALITLDFGNSNPHAGIFTKENSGWNLKKIFKLSELNTGLNELNLNAGNSSIVLSQVRSYDEELNALLDEGYLLTRVKDYWKGGRFAGMPVHYANSLGEDRLIQAFYVYKIIKENVLLIDAGTFVTMDIITASGFQGGYIIPGLKTYLQLFKQGELLQTFDLEQTIQEELPQATSDAMSWSYYAFAALAKELVRKHNISKILITGGQGAEWSKMFGPLDLSSNIQLVPELIHSSLHFWMTTQIEPL
jgi:pantothenate kinase type III